MNPIQRLARTVLTAALALATVSGRAAISPESEEGLKILNSNVVRVVYPYDLAMAGTDATVEVSYRVNPEGIATGISVVKASHPDAAAAFRASLDEMLFETAMSDGKPVLSGPQTLSVNLRQLQLAGDRSFLTAIKSPAAVVVSAREVDGGLKPAAPFAPAVFPSSLQGSELKQGRAVLEFYIDPAGVVRLPKVISATDPAMGWSAAAAVLTWRFAPPLKGGQPAIVKVVGMPVEFNAPKPAAVGTGPILKAAVFVEVQGLNISQLKVNSEVVKPLPATILLEVEANGTLRQDFKLSILNPTVGGPTEIVLRAGEIPPAKVRFTATAIETEGSARIQR